MTQSPKSLGRLAPVLFAVLLAGCAGLPAAPGNNGTAHPEFVKFAGSQSGPSAISGPVSIAANFNNTAISAGRTVWFSSAFKYSGPTTQSVTLHFDQSTIEFTANGVNYSVPVPAADVTLSPTAQAVSTVFDAASNAWITMAPFGTSGNLFLTGVAFPAVAGLPGGISPVTWKGQFSSNTPGINVTWLWAAAVYTSFDSDLARLGVKPTDDNGASAFKNSDHAGTPESFKTSVTGGARGGGGSNYTGGNSGSLVVVPTVTNAPLTGSLTFDGGKGGSLTVGRFSLLFPARAVSGKVTVSISVPDPGVLQCNLEISPASANVFAIPVTLTSDYSGGNVTDPNSLVQVWYDEAAGVWREVPGSSVNTASQTVSAPLTHFSSYGVLQGRAGW